MILFLTEREIKKSGVRVCVCASKSVCVCVFVSECVCESVCVCACLYVFL